MFQDLKITYNSQISVENCREIVKSYTTDRKYTTSCGARHNKPRPLLQMTVTC